jgi:carbamoyl-phosphate synthase large subunit
MNILFTCAGRRNYLLKYFKDNLGSSGKVLAADMQISAPSMAEADISFIVPNIYEKKYIETILNICKEYNVKLLLSLNDLELPILVHNRKMFEKEGVFLLVSNKHVIDICFDKYKTFNFIESIGLKSPQTYLNSNDILNAIETGKCSFPIVVKPRWGSASIGINFPESQNELKLMTQLAYLQLKKSILLKASSEEIENSIIFQEMIDGQEFGLDIINDLKGNYLTTIVKRKLAMRAGETDKAVVVGNMDLTNIGKKISRNLKHIGNLDCDVFFNGKAYFVIELNPRFGGGFPFSYEAGVNLPKAIIEMINNIPINKDILKPRINIGFSKCDRLVEIKF